MIGLMKELNEKYYKLSDLFPEHDIYIELFTGNTNVFWKKDKAKLNILNDDNFEVVLAYKFIRDSTEEQINLLKKMNWNKDENLFKNLSNSESPVNPISRFYKFYYLHTYEQDKLERFERIEKLKKRLIGTKIYNEDYKKILRKYNSEHTFAYLSPDKIDVKELYDNLKNFKGKFLLSINDTKEIRELFSDFNINDFNVTKFFGNENKTINELIISNYSTDSSEGLVTKGINLKSPHARMIWAGSKKLIVDGEYYKELIGKNVYLINGQLCYGIISIKEPKKIELKEFNELSDLHQLTNDELLERWEKLDEFYAYEFDVVDLFDSPKEVELKNKRLIENVKFLSTTSGVSAGSKIPVSSLQPVVKKKGD